MIHKKRKRDKSGEYLTSETSKMLLFKWHSWLGDFWMSLEVKRRSVRVGSGYGTDWNIMERGECHTPATNVTLESHGWFIAWCLDMRSLRHGNAQRSNIICTDLWEWGAQEWLFSWNGLDIYYAAWWGHKEMCAPISGLTHGEKTLMS